MALKNKELHDEKWLRWVGCLEMVTCCVGCDENAQMGFEVPAAYAQSQLALKDSSKKVSSSLTQYLDMPCGQEKVNISLSFDNKIDVPEIEFDFEYRDGKSFLNGKEATESALKELGEKINTNQNLKLATFHDKRAWISKNVQAKNVYKGGEYTFLIHKLAERDPSSSLKMFMSIQ